MVYKSCPNLDYKSTLFPPSGRSWMHENIQDKEKLLIAVGDSWTWGDSICGINTQEEIQLIDHPDRVKCIYGAKLSEMLDSDFVNIGECGGNNYDMLQRLKTVLEFNHRKYKKIYVIITLTENCRELDNGYWYTTNLENLNEFFCNYEKVMFCDYKSTFEQYKENTKFLIGRNFTYSFEENIRFIKEYHLEKTWIDCLNEHQTNTNIYPKNLRFLSRMAVRPLDNYFKKINCLDRFKDDMITELDKGAIARQWLQNSPYNHKARKTTKHPTIEGHDIWAKYLYENFITGE